MDRAALHFLFSNLLKGFAGLGIILGMYLIGRRYFGPDDFAWLVGLADMPLVFYGIFFLSETVIGIIPPEVYMLLAGKDSWPVYFEKLALLTFLSYLAGLLAYYLGRWAGHTGYGHQWLASRKMQRYTQLYQQHGGLAIFLSAVSPLPFGLFSTLSGMFRFPLLHYAWIAAFRVIRFFVYGFIVWKTVQP